MKTLCYRSFLIVLFIFALIPVFTKTLVFKLPALSDSYDCDDGALAMLDRFTELGIRAIPIVGNIHQTGEDYLESDHVWILAEIAGIWIAFDRGMPWFDPQRYEGYPVTRGKLLEFVAQDFR